MRRDDLVVLAAIVPHRQHSDRAAPDDRQRSERLLAEHEHVERITVVAVGLGDESIVRGIVDRRVEHAVGAEKAGRLVELVLDLRALRDLHDRVEELARVGPPRHVVPRVHGYAHLLRSVFAQSVTTASGAPPSVPATITTKCWPSDVTS